MDTVTESDMAISMAKEGGLGIIHRFMSIQQEVEEVLKVKRHESYVVEEPFTLMLNGYTVKDAKNMMAKNKITGILIVDNNKRLVGILTARDVVLESLDQKLSAVMTPRSKIITIKQGTTINEAERILKKYKIEKLPIVDENDKVVGLITSRDILKSLEYPNAMKDKKGRLMVGAAIGVRGDYFERVQELVKAHVDILVVDIAHGHSDHTMETIKKIKKKFPDMEIVAGNVATPEGVGDLIKAGADSLKIGVGPGSMCTTRIITGCGYPQLSAIMECSKTAKKFNIPIIADGGIRYSGDVVKALGAGASTVMIGSLLAGTDESPGMTMIRNGRKYKISRGMASLGANMSKRKSEGVSSSDFGLQEYVAEGVEALVPYRGKVSEILTQFLGGLKSGMSYCGAINIKELHKKARFIQITNAGLKESFPHDVEVL
jgi:IMP dehydrogenase